MERCRLRSSAPGLQRARSEKGAAVTPVAPPSRQRIARVPSPTRIVRVPSGSLRRANSRRTERQANRAAATSSSSGVLCALALFAALTPHIIGVAIYGSLGSRSCIIARDAPDAISFPFAVGFLTIGGLVVHLTCYLDCGLLSLQADGRDERGGWAQP